MSPSRPILFDNARIIDPESGYDGPGALLVREGRIAGWSSGGLPGVPADVEWVDCRGHALAPGLIDMRVFTGEPGAEQKETLASASDAAAAGGVTTMIVMPRTDPVIDDASLVDFVLRRARDTARVRVRPMAALTRGLKGQDMTEMGLLAEAGAVGLTDAGSSVANAQVFRRCLAYAKTFGTLIMHDALEPSLTKGAVMHEGELSTRLGLAGMPDMAETIMVDRDIRLLEQMNTDRAPMRYHLAQISSARAVEALRAARRKGIGMTCGVAAHHLALNELDIANYRTFFKVLPPLRREDDRQALIEALAEGLIDVIVSSHEPQPPEDKRLPFGEAAFGAVGLETLLPAALEIYHNGRMSLPALIATMTLNPARILGLKAGRLTTGAPADLVLFDPDAPFVLEADDLRSRSRNTPFDGRRFQGKILRTLMDGQTVFSA